MPTALPGGEIPGIFEDFDSKVVFKRCEAAVLSKDTKNFVLEFDNSFAKCALNLDLEGVKKVCSSNVRDQGLHFKLLTISDG